MFALARAAFSYRGSIFPSVTAVRQVNLFLLVATAMKLLQN